jgi:hypothetical protein
MRGNHIPVCVNCVSSGFLSTINCAARQRECILGRRSENRPVYPDSAAAASLARVSHSSGVWPYRSWGRKRHLNFKHAGSWITGPWILDSHWYQTVRSAGLLIHTASCTRSALHLIITGLSSVFVTRTVVQYQSLCSICSSKQIVLSVHFNNMMMQFKPKSI